MSLTAADLCHPVSARYPFTRSGWLFELKHDGFRCFARSAEKWEQIELRTRSGRSIRHAFPEIAGAVRRLPDGVYDGELVVPDRHGRSDFEELRRRALLTREISITDAMNRRPAVLVLFDVLELNGGDVRNLPLRERKEWLGNSVEHMNFIQVIESLETDGETLFAAAVDQDQEGIVAKRLDAPYRAGRQESWVKIKNKAYSRQAAVVWQG